VNYSDTVQVLESLVELHGYHDDRLLREETPSTVLGHQLMQILPKRLKLIYLWENGYQIVLRLLPAKLFPLVNRWHIEIEL
jgi:hypothetical protein